MRIHAVFMLLVALLGCTGQQDCQESYIRVGDECCLDQDANGACDDTEESQMVVVVDAPDPSCDDGLRNQGEEDVDCGGPCSPCPPKPTCEDGIQNQGEEQIDCGGPCVACARKPTCYDGIWNQGEDNVDCGGPCDPCPDAQLPVEGVDEEPFTPWECDDAEDGKCYCVESIIKLTDPFQDAYVGDLSEPLDGRGDSVGYPTYNMVGDLADTENLSVDNQYRTIIAFPIGELYGNLSDAKLNVLPYLAQGTQLDTLVEHINCTGNIRREDYGSAPNSLVGVIISSTDSNDVKYSIDITESLQKDLRFGREYSCYRLLWNQSQLEELDNEVIDRRIIYGEGSQYAPHITFIRRPCVRCEMNRDCGEKEYISEYQCHEKAVIRQFLNHRCVEPGTEQARCAITQDWERFDTCDSSETCINGEDRCYPSYCYDGESNYDEDDEDCGGECRPCHCFDQWKNHGELGFNCGGPCKPCLTDRRLPVVKIISPRHRETYNTTQVYLRYLTNKEQVWCWFSLNDDVNTSVEGARFIKAEKGPNTLMVYCNDTMGNVGSGGLNFNVLPIKSQVCAADDVELEYMSHFESVIYFRDSLAQLGYQNECDLNSFLPATTRHDSSGHEKDSVDYTELMEDRLFTENETARLSYGCISGVGHESEYMHLVSGRVPMNNTIFKGIIYFKEEDVVSSENSFWRTYLYMQDSDTVDAANYVDVPYLPVNSSCDRHLDVKYQELDLSGLFFNRTFDGYDGTDLRLTLYSRNPLSSVQVRELEYTVN